MGEPIASTTINYFLYDLPSNIFPEGDIGIKIKTTGNRLNRDRIYLISLIDVKGNIYLIHFPTPEYASPCLRSLLTQEERIKVFHDARFELGFILNNFGFIVTNLYCLQTAAVFARTHSNNHSLEHLCCDLLNLQLPFDIPRTAGGRFKLTVEEQTRAALDVKYLFPLRTVLNEVLTREKKFYLLLPTLKYISSRVVVDVSGFTFDIFYSPQMATVY